MFVFSFKASTLKYIGVMGLCTMAIVLTVSAVPDASRLSAPVSAETSAENKISFKNIDSNKKRVQFLENCGWQVDSDAVSEGEAYIPDEFDEVYEKYNELQKKDGLNLEKYRSKKVDAFVYRVVTSDGKDALATILIYKNRIIGGDVSSPESDGFVMSLCGEAQVK